MIQILDNHTIDQIAAGEVVERPSSVVKELIENAMDAGATAITVEIKQGGIEYIRVSDNGTGISKADMEKAFLRHATSKLHDIDDLSILSSMGFRGEALASIAAVSKMECISKTKDSLLGYRYVIAGGEGEAPEEVGAPDGTTMVVRNLFYNTPARRKFLKTETTEAGYIEDMLQHLSMARPDISFQFISSGKTKLSTTGNNDLGELVYRIYGRDTARECFSVDSSEEGVNLRGILGTPSANRSNRNGENFFVNSRYVKSDIISKALEEGYHGYVMQHKYPFCVLHIDLDPCDVDVNVHPAKTEIRLKNGNQIYELISRFVQESLRKREMITALEVSENKSEKVKSPVIPQAFETNRMVQELRVSEALKQNNNTFPVRDDVSVQHIAPEINNNDSIFQVSFDDAEEQHIEPSSADIVTSESAQDCSAIHSLDTKKIEVVSSSKAGADKAFKASQISFFPEEDKVLSKSSRSKFEIIGQLFDTYWIITYQDSVYFIDQHAAHEKVNYEKLMAKYAQSKVVSQQLNPPIVVSISAKEKTFLLENEMSFHQLGFEFEEFGGNEIALRSVPMEVYFKNEKDMFLELLSELSETNLRKDPETITAQIATMACKASVKGGKKMTRDEVEKLIDDLLLCDNPYHCPHGRPTIFSMSRYELEKKFKRIVE